MTDNNQQLAVRSNPLAITSFDEMDRVAKQIADSGMFGCKTPAQAFALMMLCNAEGLNPIDALRRFFIIEGKPSRRADSIASDFESQGGAIIWNLRTDEMVGATFFADKKTVDDAARKRAKERFKTLWELIYEEKPEKRSQLMEKIADLSHEGEDTIIRTLDDAVQKKLAMSYDRDAKEWKMKHNWMQSPRQMLTARVVSEGVRLIKPSVIAGMGTEDEVRDTIDMQHQQLLQDAGQSGPSLSDKEAMQSILDGHLANAATATNQQDKQRHLGLAAEMRCKIAEAEEAAKPKPETQSLPAPGKTEEPTPTKETPAKHVETEVLPPETKEAKNPDPATGAETPEEDWMKVVCTYGTTKSNKFFGRTMKEMFVSSSLDSATKLADWFMEKSKFVEGVKAKLAENIELDGIEEENYFALLKGKQHVVKRIKEAATTGGAQ